MKKSSLTTAVLAGLAGVVGFAGSAGAVDINPDGTGQSLIYPYYTTRAGQDTIISVVNSTDTGKAVKVRFLEGYNSREVLDFNLFLSKYDVWTGTIFDLGAHGAGSGAAVSTYDRSCTVPNKSSWTPTGGDPDGYYVPFSNGAYSGSHTDSGPTGMDRTREGYVELLTMADVEKGSATETALTHVQVPNVPDSGVPKSCGSMPTGDMGDLVDPTGGLFGSGMIVNVAEGTLYPYNADAIDGWRSIKKFTPSQDVSPSLADANNTGMPGVMPGDARAFVFQGAAGVVQATYGNNVGAGDPVDAVSAVFAASALLNEWAADAGAGIGTDWVVTFPTKRFYVDQAPPASPPFVWAFGEPDTNPAFDPPRNGAGQSCVQVGLGIYDQEEGYPLSGPSGGFSPPPPDAPPSSLCHEVNVLSISDSSDPVSILGSEYTGLALNVQRFGSAGWMRLDLNPNPGTEPHVMVPSAEGVVFNGLPATGFQATRYINASAAPGKLANYAGAFHHRVERDITSAQLP